MRPTLPDSATPLSASWPQTSPPPEIQTGPSAPGLPEFDGAFRAGPTPPSGHPGAAARFRRERRGQGRSLSRRAVQLTVRQGRVRGIKEGQGAMRVSIRHRPCSQRRRATTGHCAQQRRSTSARQAREARDRTTHRAHTAPPPRGYYTGPQDPSQHWPLPDCARWARTACHHTVAVTASPTPEAPTCCGTGPPTAQPAPDSATDNSPRIFLLPLQGR